MVKSSKIFNLEEIFGKYLLAPSRPHLPVRASVQKGNNWVVSALTPNVAINIRKLAIRSEETDNIFVI